MKRIFNPAILSIVFVLLLFSLAEAHDYWIKPESFQPETGSLIKAGFTGSHSYFKNEEVPDVSRFRQYLVTPDNDSIPISFSRIDTSAAWSKVPVIAQGTHILSAVSTRPAYWCKTRKGWKSGKRFDHTGVLKSGEYIKSVKTFFNAGEPSESYSKRLGHKIEIVPEVNPTILSSGDKLELSVFFKGKKREGIKVFGIYQGFDPEKHSEHPVQATTDSNGNAVLKLKHSGVWLIGAKHRVKSPSKSDVDYVSNKSYIMFKVK